MLDTKRATKDASAASQPQLPGPITSKELPAKLLDYFLWSNKSIINQSVIDFDFQSE